MSAVQRRQSPRAAGSEENIRLGGRPNYTTAGSPLQLVMPRLEGAQYHGKNVRTICPSCGGKSRKLAITEGDNGTLLLHCFAGCTAHDVLSAIGLTVGDLFPRRDLRTMTPAERSQLRQAALLPRWRAAMEALQHEATVLLIAANKLGDGLPLDDDELTRMRVAALAVFDAGEVLHAR